MARNTGRPLSPHLTIWRWGPHMLVSILHRVTGSALAVGGAILFVWWLLALAGGEASYARFVALATTQRGHLAILPLVVLVGLTWSFLQHLCSGVRHLLLDTGAGYELRVNKLGAMATLLISATLTILIWAAILTQGL